MCAPGGSNIIQEYISTSTLDLFWGFANAMLIAFYRYGIATSGFCLMQSSTSNVSKLSFWETTHFDRFRPNSWNLNMAKRPWRHGNDQPCAPWTSIFQRTTLDAQGRHPGLFMVAPHPVTVPKVCRHPGSTPCSSQSSLQKRSWPRVDSPKRAPTNSMTRNHVIGRFWLILGNYSG